MRNFLIVGTQRTGSSAVGEAIGLHPEITCGWEWTLRVPPHRKLGVAERALAGDFSVLDDEDREHMNRVCRQEKLWLGFRRLFRSSDKWVVHPRLAPALWIDRLESHLSWLARHPETHIVHITRTDNVEWLKSKEMSRMNKTYWGREYDSDAKIEIDLGEAVKRSISKNWVDRRLGTLSETNPYLRINYEDFFSNIEQGVTRLFDFFRCDGTKAKLEERKAKRQSNRQTFEYISNYEELVAVLEERGLRYSNAIAGW